MKAVLFDVYETLLTGHRCRDLDGPLREVAAKFGVSFPSDQSLADRLEQEIRSEHQRSNHSYPEVDIREVWKRIFPGLFDADAFALAAEEAVHPVTLIPGMAERILKFRADGLKLGIISNAQAYTRTLLERHLGEAWQCFDNELLFFSYEHRTSKPGHDLFQLAIDQLSKCGISPHEILMIGDSMKNDIEPARGLGMKARQAPL
ncbi:HAD family hydrolase [Haloferula chungangensis]|uniref:HAD family hydrolase n=1 Tax=Haloferula chungangensis TaxID=1048331 RepID=A0ABW2L5M2_9BACT